MMTDDRRAVLLGLSLSELVELIGVTETSVARLIEERDALKAERDELAKRVKAQEFALAAYIRTLNAFLAERVL